MRADKPNPAHAPSDADLRVALRARLASKLGQDDGAVLIDELGLVCGQVRVDLALVNGYLHGYEIKSARDSLRRLPSQVRAYSGVLDRVTLVAAGKHLREALRLVPDWWELIIAKPHTPNGLVLTRIRAGKRNPAANLRSLVELLWYEDAIELLRAHRAERGVVGKPRRFVWDKLCTAVAAKDIRAAVLDGLKAREARLADRRRS